MIICTVTKASKTRLITRIGALYAEPLDVWRDFEHRGTGLPGAFQAVLLPGSVARWVAEAEFFLRHTYID